MLSGCSPVSSQGLSSHMRVAGLAAPPQEDGRAGLGPVLAVALALGGPVVVDLRPPGVRGDDPRGRPPLLQGIRGFDALLDLVSGPQSAVRLDQTFT